VRIPTRRGPQRQDLAAARSDGHSPPRLRSQDDSCGRQDERRAAAGWPRLIHLQSGRLVTPLDPARTFPTRGKSGNSIVVDGVASGTSFERMPARTHSAGIVAGLAAIVAGHLVVEKVLGAPAVPVTGTGDPGGPVTGTAITTIWRGCRHQLPRRPRSER
jgi:hypothetical protein